MRPLSGGDQQIDPGAEPGVGVSDRQIPQADGARLIQPAPARLSTADSLVDGSRLLLLQLDAVAEPTALDLLHHLGSEAGGETLQVGGSQRCADHLGGAPGERLLTALGQVTDQSALRLGQLGDSGQLLGVGVVDVKRVEVAAESCQRGLGGGIG
jgi:hypothetical protein